VAKVSYYSIQISVFSVLTRPKRESRMFGDTHSLLP
jgi:hypothetical protein